MSLMVTDEPEFDCTPNHKARNHGTRIPTTREANLVDDYLWLSEGGMSLESIAQRLGFEQLTMEQSLIRAGFTYAQLHPRNDQ